MSSGILFSVGQGPLVDQGHLIFEASRSNTGTPHSVGLPWTSDKPDAETYSCTTHNTHIRQTDMPSVGFEPPFSATDRPQNQALDGAANVIDNKINYIQ